MASMRATVPRVGYTDLLAMPEDGNRYEIHGGELLVVPSPLPRHQIVNIELCTALRAYAYDSGGLALIAPLDIVFDEFDVVQPDIVFFRAERRHRVGLDAVTSASPGCRDRGGLPVDGSDRQGQKDADVRAVWGARVLDRRSGA